MCIRGVIVVDRQAMSYLQAGVDIEAGNSLVEKIKPLAKRTHRSGVLGGLGGFGALFELPTGYQQPVLVSGTDGVGTKLALAQQFNRHNTIGIDLVAMCVNDIVVTGAEPLYFLDYYATGKLSVEVATQVIEGISEGCLQAGCALAGGETAEMPGFYEGEKYDLAGFAVGIVEKADMIHPQRIQAGDVLIALASSGPHSNGYSLIRRIMTREIPNETMQTQLMAPTKIYVKTILALLKQHTVHGIAHITGGGITENLPRILPIDTRASIHLQSWQLLDVFAWLQQVGQVEQQEMLRTFNCGVGMILAVPQEEAAAIMGFCQGMGEIAWQIGHVEAHDGTPHVHYLS